MSEHRKPVLTVVPSGAATLRKLIQEQRSLLFIAGYLDKENGQYHPRPIDPDDYRGLWNLWRSLLAQHAPPVEPNVRTLEDAQQALDALLRRLEELFGAVPPNETVDTFQGIPIGDAPGKTATGTSIPEQAEEKKNRGKTKRQPPPLTDKEEAVLTIITKQPKGKGITGKCIIAELSRQGIELEQSTLTRHIIPKLKKKPYEVKNRPNVGYYVSKL